MALRRAIRGVPASKCYRISGDRQEIVENGKVSERHVDSTRIGTHGAALVGKGRREREHWWNMNVNTNAKAALEKSVDRYLRAIA